MAVSQVERLKNPCRVWMWNRLGASQPPPSAPATPIRQVRMRPCDLLPGISILASRPAPRPRTIHAMMPITDSSVSDEIDMGGGRSCATGRGGRNDLPRALALFWAAAPFLAPGPNTKKKTPGPALPPEFGCTCQGPEQLTSYYPGRGTGVHRRNQPAASTGPGRDHGRITAGVGWQQRRPQQVLGPVDRGEDPVPQDVIGFGAIPGDAEPHRGQGVRECP